MPVNGRRPALQHGNGKKRPKIVAINPQRCGRAAATGTFSNVQRLQTRLEHHNMCNAPTGTKFLSLSPSLVKICLYLPTMPSTTVNKSTPKELFTRVAHGHLRTGGSVIAPNKPLKVPVDAKNPDNHIFTEALPQELVCQKPSNTQTQNRSTYPTFVKPSPTSSAQRLELVFQRTVTKY